MAITRSLLFVANLLRELFDLVVGFAAGPARHAPGRASISRRSLYGRLLRTVLANPRYVYFVTRRPGYSKMARRLAADRLPQNGTFYPVKLDLRIVYGCNLRCQMCAQWGNAGTFFDYGGAKLQRRLELRVIDSVVKELAPHGLRYVDLEGGETFLYPDIIELLRRLKRHGLFVKPVTNGTVLAKYAEDVVAARTDAIHVSVDGDRASHNFVRQAEWAYDRTMEGLRALVEARARAGTHRPLIQVSFTMTRHNGASALRKLCDELAGRGLIDLLAIKAGPIWVPKQRGQAYNRLVERYFGVTGIKSWTGFQEDYRDYAAEAEEVAATIREVKRKNYDFFVHSLPGIPTDQIPRLYTDYDWNLGRTHCPIPYLEPTVDSDGNVYPCNLFTDEPLSMGNVYEQPFLEIWFGARFQQFRRMLAEQGGLLPICNRCCQLTEH